MEKMTDLKIQFKKYVIPSVAAMWVFSLYSMVDGIFVSKGVGSDALAAVNISTPYINMLFALAILFATGASTVVIMLVSLLNLDNIAVFLGATSSTMEHVKDYLGTIMLFVLFYLGSHSSLYIFYEKEESLDL
ncbi:MAG: MATE family efflux transporter [Peptostreptococcaceae bacterium]